MAVAAWPMVEGLKLERNVVAATVIDSTTRLIKT